VEDGEDGGGRWRDALEGRLIGFGKRTARLLGFVEAIAGVTLNGTPVVRMPTKTEIVTNRLVLNEDDLNRRRAVMNTPN